MLNDWQLRVFADDQTGTPFAELLKGMAREILELRAALLRYGCHAFDCDKWHPVGPGKALVACRKCTCGLEP